jgi:formamidopyrimidine-DNA glycosylase
MPELPEVETFVRGLAPAVGQTIRSTEVLDAKVAVSSEELTGARIQGIRRRGKYIGIEFSDGRALVVHLRMSGRLRLECRECETRYTRMILRLDDGQCIYFVDPRRLGTADVHADGFDLALGYEPLDAAFTTAALAELAGQSRAPIKQLLLDQRKVAGIGNIYAAESLWRAQTRCRRRRWGDCTRPSSAYSARLWRSSERRSGQACRTTARLPPRAGRSRTASPSTAARASRASGAARESNA